MRIHTKKLFYLLSIVSLLVSITLGIVFKEEFMMGPFVTRALVTYLLITSAIFFLIALLYRRIEKSNDQPKIGFIILTSFLTTIGLVLSYNIWEHIVMTMFLMEKTEEAIFAFEKVMTITDICGLVLLFSGLIILLVKLFSKNRAQVNAYE